MKLVHRSLVWSHLKLRGEADSFASHGCSHANVLYQQAHTQVPNQPGRLFSQLGAHMDPGSMKHPWAGVSCAYTPRLQNHLCYWAVSSQTLVLSPCSSRGSCAPAVSQWRGCAQYWFGNSKLCPLAHIWSLHLDKILQMFFKRISSVQCQIGWGLEQTGLGENVPCCGWELELDMLWRSLPSQIIPWFYEISQMFDSFTHSTSDLNADSASLPCLEAVLTSWLLLLHSSSHTGSTSWTGCSDDGV